MSLADGWAAIHLEMPPRVPRTEYSADSHWPLVSRVTGLDISHTSDAAARRAASSAFRAAWNYDFVWSILIHNQALEACRTDMGHAEYASGGVDKRTTLSCPFREPEEVLAFDPWEVYGPIDVPTWTAKFEQHYRDRCDATPDAVNMTGIYVTLISGLIEIFGWDMLLMAAGIDPEGFGAVAGRYASWIGQYFEALAAADVPVVMVHDDIVWTSGPFLHPDWYRRFVFPHYRALLGPLRDSGKRIAYTSDGDYTAFIDDIAAAGVHGFVMEPTTRMEHVAERYGRTHFFIGNVDTRVLLSGTRGQIRAEVERCMAIGKGCPGFFLAVGNHIPSNTPVDNALYYNEVYKELSRR